MYMYKKLYKSRNPFTKTTKQQNSLALLKPKLSLKKKSQKIVCQKIVRQKIVC